MVEALAAVRHAGHVAPVTGRDFTATAVDPASVHLLSGVAQPANTLHGDDPLTLWLAPGRVMVVAFNVRVLPPGDFVSDITDGQAVWRMSGGNVDAVLAMGTSLDRALLAPGHCAQTIFAGVRALLYPHDSGMYLQVERPLAAFVADWLKQAATALEGIS